MQSYCNCSLPITQPASKMTMINGPEITNCINNNLIIIIKGPGTDIRHLRYDSVARATLLTAVGNYKSPDLVDFLCCVKSCA